MYGTECDCSDGGLVRSSAPANCRWSVHAKPAMGGGMPP